MTSREKIEHIVQDIMGWTYFPTWDLAHTARWALEHDPITYPYAFWNDQREGVSVFYRDMEDARPFNPLESIDDAWQVIQSLQDVDHLTLWARKDASGHASCSLALRTPHGEHIFIRDIDCHAETMPEAICLAALKSVGVDIT